MGILDGDRKGSDSDDEESSDESDNTEAAVPVPNLPKSIIAPLVPAPASPPVPTPAPLSKPSTSSLSQTTTTHVPPPDTDLTQEKLASLSLLHTLFGARNSDDWGGRESLGSDIDDEEIERLKNDGGRGNIGAGIDRDGEIDEVPMEADHAGRKVGRGGGDEDIEMAEAQEASKQEAVVEQQVKVPIQIMKLKDLFAPREDGVCHFFYVLPCLRHIYKPN
jgi:hypothetical protein